jgi:EAL domain-containing protein (putative c-di-GMP-specific phosphodiesterase class I)
MLPANGRFPGALIEVMEEDLINNPEWMYEVAVQLRLYKAEISIDDFGMGYSSLVRLGQLPFTEIKLDQSFVAGCASDAKKRHLCQASVDLAHRMGAAVCAEGVDGTDDLRLLVEFGCDRAQGYLFAQPMPAADFVARLAAANTKRKFPTERIAPAAPQSD